MIGLLVDLVTGLVNGLLELLPSWTPIDISGPLADLTAGPAGSIFGGLAWANWYAPVSEMINLGLLWLGIETGTQLVRLIIWVLQLFHIAGGSQ